jgi:hypothetical protein
MKVVLKGIHDKAHSVWYIHVRTCMSQYAFNYRISINFISKGVRATHDELVLMVMYSSYLLAIQIILNFSVKCAGLKIFVYK